MQNKTAACIARGALVRKPQSAIWSILSHAHVWPASLFPASLQSLFFFPQVSLTCPSKSESTCYCFLLELSFLAFSSFLSLFVPFQAALDHFNMASHHSGYPTPLKSLYHFTLFRFLPSTYAILLCLCFFIAYQCSCQFLHFLVSTVFSASRTGLHNRCSRNKY